MAGKDDLRQFLETGLMSGATPERLRAALVRAGWSEAEVDSALSGWMLEPGMPPIPRPRNRIAPRDALIQALGLVAIIVCAIFIVRVGFVVAELVTPEIGRSHPWSGAGRWPVAILVAFLPVFAAIHLRRRPVGPPLLRRWLAVLSGFLSGLAILGAAAAAVQAFLAGDLTMRFGVKLFVVIVTALLAWLTYNTELAEGRRSRKAAGAFVGLGIVAILAGIAATGGPALGRAENRDAQRRSDVSSIAMQARCLVEDGQIVPPIGVSPACPELPSLVDPWTGEPYRIEQVGQSVLQICADFETEPRLLGGHGKDGCTSVDLRDD